MQDFKAHYHQLCDQLFAQLKAGENLSCSLSGEDQLYVRFNNSKVRQSTHVKQIDFTMQLQTTTNLNEWKVNLNGNPAEDFELCKNVLARLRSESADLPTDPFLVPMANSGTSDQEFAGRVPSEEELVQNIADKTTGSDFTGLYAGGISVRANRNNLGQNHWFSTTSFFVDYSLYTKNEAGENKAVKEVYAGNQWNLNEFLKSFQHAQSQLQILRRPNKTLQPGKYRVYLGPHAAADILGIAGWGAFSFGAYKRGQSAFAEWMDKKRSLSPKLSIVEDFSMGWVPRFNNLGELAPEQLTIAEKGQLKHLLISSRSAKEYAVESTGATPFEGPRSLRMLNGTLAQEQILQRLGTGIYINQVHYLNWSDQQSARVTGMTRYACFWVENGQIVAPIKDMRFDDSLFRMWGDQLEELTDFAVVFPTTDTYFQRQLGGVKVPGLLLKELSLTL